MRTLVLALIALIAAATFITALDRNSETAKQEVMVNQHEDTVDFFNN
ncbi:MAG: hypothetical protein FWH41_07115 [Treponema sp.]|nr:hypothetical protein [Treponema sp.]